MRVTVVTDGQPTDMDMVHEAGLRLLCPISILFGQAHGWLTGRLTRHRQSQYPMEQLGADTHGHTRISKTK